MNDEEKKQIADYINTYRMYPDNYKGSRDLKILRQLNRGFRYDGETNTVTRLEGHINDNGDFEIVGSFTFPFDKPEEKNPSAGYTLDYVKKSFSELLHEWGYTYNLDSWTIRDIVSEAEYIRSTYYQKGHVNNDMRYTNLKEWTNRTQRIRYYIRTYKPYIEGVTCYQKHNSKYDD